ncbi:MAG TPA: PRC-barrel domain-containing protein [Stellaceae bacterium]|nr:PRC-barrel domain-containing protein [Stellaceae bacterium]
MTDRPLTTEPLAERPVGAAPVGERPVETDETDRLISSEKVEDTTVYNRDGDKLGVVRNLMIDKYTGKVEYAVMSFGGFLGIGDSYSPLPWRALTYDTRMGGYVVDADRSRLERAPRFTPSSEPDWADAGYRSRVDEYWIPPL